MAAIELPCLSGWGRAADASVGYPPRPILPSMPILRRVLLLAMCVLLALPGARGAGDCMGAGRPRGKAADAACCGTTECCCTATAVAACPCGDEQPSAPAPSIDRLGLAIASLDKSALDVPRFATIHAAPRTLTAALPPPPTRAHWVLPHRTRQVVYSVW